MIRRLWPLTLGAFALGLDAYVLAGLLPGMARDLSTSQAMAGLGVALFTAAYAVSAPALAFLAGRSSTRKALLPGLSLFTLGNVVTMRHHFRERFGTSPSRYRRSFATFAILDGDVARVGAKA